MKNIYLQILDKQNDPWPLALATVVRTKGSTPQKPGSSALFGSSGLMAGTVGGGVLEGKVQEIALKAGIQKESSLFQFYLDKDISEKEEAICGGQVTLLIDADTENSLPEFEEIRKSMDEKIPGVLITMVSITKETITVVNRHWMSGDKRPDLPQKYLEKIEPEINNMLLKADRYDFRELELSMPGEEPSPVCFLEPVYPLPELVIAGAGHIGKMLAHLGQMLDFEVTVIDDRTKFANRQNIPNADHIIAKDIGEAMQALKKTPDTYIVIVTRGHKDDANALKSCIGSDAAYVGMIGSKNKIAIMHDEFIRNSWATQAQWDRILAPIGIDIKSKTVEEIAVSIAAQLVLVRNSKKSRNG